MHRLFLAVDEPQNSSSWVDTLSKTVSWFNPLGHSQPLIRNLFLGTLSLLATVTKASSDGDEKNVCFLDNTFGPILWGNENTLSCNDGENAKNLYNIIKDNGCNVYQNDPSYGDCAIWLVEKMDFGQGYFGGSRCTLATHSTPNACVVDVLNNNVKKGFGTSEDIVTTICIAGGGMVTLACVAGITIFACRKKRNQQNTLAAQEAPAQPMSSPADNGPGSYGKLDETMPLNPSPAQTYGSGM